MVGCIVAKPTLPQPRGVDHFKVLCESTKQTPKKSTAIKVTWLIFSHRLGLPHLTIRHVYTLFFMPFHAYTSSRGF